MRDPGGSRRTPDFSPSVDSTLAVPSAPGSRINFFRFASEIFRDDKGGKAVGFRDDKKGNLDLFKNYKIKN